MKLFSRANPTEKVQSNVLVQPFLTGLWTPIRQELLLKECPTTIDKAVKRAMEVEYTIQFGQETLEVHLGQDTTEDILNRYTTVLRCIWILELQDPSARRAQGRVTPKSIYTKAPWYICYTHIVKPSQQLYEHLAGFLDLFSLFLYKVH